MTEMAYSEINNGIKQEQTTHFHDLLHAQLSADDSRNNDINDSAEESGESPLDFSIKRKPTGYDEVSGSDSLSSPASSLNDTGGHMEDRKSDTDGGSINKSSSSQESPSGDRSPLFHHKQFKNDRLHSEYLSMHERIGQPKPADQSSSVASMFHEHLLGLANANMFNSFPTMAALMDPRRLSASTKMSARPFKAYPKDALSIPSEVGAIPHYLTSFANFENSALMQGLNLSSEEVFTIYKQQLMALKERDKYIENLKISTELAGSRSSTATSSSPSTSLPPSLSSIHLASTMAARANGFNGNQLLGIGGGPKATPSPFPSPYSNGSNKNNNNNHSDTNNDNSGSMPPSPGIPGLTASGRRRPRSLPDEQKDEAYWERRRKNNEAAKRSRDARRAKEDQIAIRAALLEQENLKLRVEVAALKTETAKLRCMLYNS